MTVRLFLAAVFLCAAIQAGPAQGRNLSLPDCIRIGEENNLGIAGDRHRKEADGERVREAKSGNFPSLNAAIEYGKSRVSPARGDSWQEQSNISSRVTVPIFEGFRTKYDISAAKSGLTATDFESVANRLKLRRLISLAFYKIEIGQRELELAQRIAQRRREQKQLLELRFKAGSEPRWAVTQAESEITDSLVDIEEITAELDSNRDDLRQLLNLPPTEVLTVTGGIRLTPSPSPEDLSAIVQQLPDIQAAAARLEQQRAQVQLEKSDRWPKISAFGSWQRDMPEIQQGSTAFGIEANMKLFDPGSSARIRKIQESVAAVEMDLSDLRTRAVVNLRRSIREYRIALKKLDSMRLGMDAAQERAKIIGEEYAAGFRQYLEWEQTERQLVQFEKGSYAAEKSAAIARVELEFISAGKIL
jgi:outer membrane protein TolC